MITVFRNFLVEWRRWPGIRIEWFYFRNRYSHSDHMHGAYGVLDRIWIEAKTLSEARLWAATAVQEWEATQYGNVMASTSLQKPTPTETQ